MTTKTAPKETIGRTRTRKFYEAHYSRQGTSEWYQIKATKALKFAQESETLDGAFGIRAIIKDWLRHMQANAIDAGNGFIIQFPKSNAKYDVRIVHVTRSIEVIDFIEAD